MLVDTDISVLICLQEESAVDFELLQVDVQFQMCAYICLLQVNSTSYMLLNEHYFYSMTENLFDLYDVEKNVLGNVKEQIEVNLLTVEI